MTSCFNILCPVCCNTSVTTWRNPSISFRLLVPPELVGSLWTRSSIVPGSGSRGWRRLMGGSGVEEVEIEGGGEETSEADSSSSCCS